MSPARCEKCGHAPHPGLRCLNMASDNDCSCDLRPAERRAPIQGATPGSITWDEHVEVWEAYAARYGRRQSAERIAERGGFGYLEIEMFTGRKPRTFVPRDQGIGSR